MSLDNDQKKEESPYMEMPRDNDQKHAYIGYEMQLQNHSLTFVTKTNHSLQLSAFYLVDPWLTTLLLPWKS